MFGQRGGNSNSTGDCKEDTKRWWVQCPFFFKFLFTTQFVLYGFSWILPIIPALLTEVPYRTVQMFFFWTTVTTCLVPDGLFGLLIGLYLVYYDGKVIEQRIGTVHYCLELFFKNFLIQMGYITCMYLAYFMFSNAYFITSPSIGLFPTFMLFLALRGLAEPEQERPFCCFPFNVKNKYYVWILYAIFVVISGSLRIELLMAIGVAYLEVYVFKGQILSVSKARLQKIENSCLFRRYNTRADFITLNNAGGDAFEMTAPQQQQQAEPVIQQQAAFQGRGVSIGQSAAGNFSVPQQQEVVINPSANSQFEHDQQQQLRNAAAEAALARLEKEEDNNENEGNNNNNNNNNDNDDIEKHIEEKNQQKQKDGYNQFTDEKQQQDDLI